MNKTNSVIFLILLIFSFSSWGEEKTTEPDIQERKYVTDKLRLSLYKKADSKSGSIKLLTSGDVLDVLEISGAYSKVKTSAGLTGWVKKGFLVSIPTASFLLIEETKKNEELIVKLEKYSNTQSIIDDYENTIDKINNDNDLTLQENNKLNQELEQIKKDKEGLKQQVNAYKKNTNHLSMKDIVNIVIEHWQIVTILLFSLFIIGFIIGRGMVKAQVRKRFQGVKVL